MVIRSILAILLFGAFGANSVAQYFNANKIWQQDRNEIVVGIGGANYLGELGGRNAIGRDFIYDLELSLTRFSTSVMHRRFFRRQHSISYGFHIGTIRGDDKLTDEPYRRNRNIHFRSTIFELSGRYEWHFVNEYPGHQYRIRKVIGKAPERQDAYLFGGIGVFYHNPKAQYNGSWTALQPLGTEGQGLNGTNYYSLFQMAIPFGIGYRYKVSRTFRIGLEFGFRKTFTDYLDDTSTLYYDPEILYERRGPEAEFLSNPSDGAQWLDYNVSTDDNAPPFRNPAYKGLERGDPTDLDSYMFLQLTGSFKVFHYSKNHRLKPRHGNFRRYGRNPRKRAKL